MGCSLAVIRGTLLPAHKIKEKEKHINVLTANLKSLESGHVKYNDADVLKQIQDRQQTK